MNEQIEKLKQGIGNVLLGKEKTAELVMIGLLCRGHVLLEDVPGTGKTMLAKSIAKSINGKFKRIQFTPDVLPSDVTGIQFFNPKEQCFEMRPGPVMTNILLADEINRATPRTQSSLLEVMEEQQVTIEGETLPIDPPFIVLATQNPIESQGTFPLPEAQMDRFLMQIRVGYPTREQEKEMMQRYRKEEPIDALEQVFSLEDILDLQKQVKEVVISDAVEDYLLSIVRATRKSELTDTGVSPRGTLAFMRAVQAKAFTAGRTYVIPEDVKEMAPIVLAHRLVLSLEGEMSKTKPQVLEMLLDEIEVPVEAGAVRE
ncbi:AAA family ATPase [Virgibacillus siamensis]|uniref:AAA family ATPase n=1 Tax=Virgibacillus siamensis TaxID=480071 RepID=UPI00158C572C|nr:MoxR family ATPase [Virgibacillus siamensis]